MSEEEKRKALRDGKRCFVCFREGHGSRTCKANISCILCDKRHHVIMCSRLKEAKDCSLVETRDESGASHKNASKEMEVPEATSSKELLSRMFKSEVNLMTLTLLVG